MRHGPDAGAAGVVARIGMLGIRHPRRALALWAVVIGLLAVAGIGVEGRLHNTGVTISGTPAARAQAAIDRQFGHSNPLTAVVAGPSARVLPRARALAASLQRLPGVDVIGPWAPGAGSALRPRAGVVILVIRADGDFDRVTDELVPRIRTRVKAAGGGAVRTYLTGFADAAHGLQRSSLDAIAHAEPIAVPLLLIVLLLVLRSAIAAGVPLAVGLATIGASRGVLSLVNLADPLDVTALSLSSMMGLALGVDYGLLLVARMREELGDSGDARAAVATAVAQTLPTVVFAGLAVAGAMVVTVLLAPGDVIVSGAVGVLSAIGLGLFTALTALPAALSLLGPAIDRFTLGSGRLRGSRVGGWALRIVRRPAVAAAVVLALLGGLAAPALALRTGAPDPREMPAGAAQRTDFQAVRRILGTGWTAPYQVLLVADRGRITDAGRLRAITRWQRQVAAQPAIRATFGPASLAAPAGRLRAAARSVVAAPGQLGRGRRGARRLGQGLQRAADGAERLRGGVGRAAAGARRLHAGAGALTGALDRIEGGVARSESGAGRLRSGAFAARAGMAALAPGLEALRTGSGRLTAGLGRARTAVGGARRPIARLGDRLRAGGRQLQRLRRPAVIADGQLAGALRALGRMSAASRGDPQYGATVRAVATAEAAISGRNPLTGARVRAGYPGLPSALGRAARQSARGAAGVGVLVTRIDALGDGLGRLSAGAGRLRDGLRRSDAGAGRLLSGLGRLSDGAGRLSTGLGALRGGVGRTRAGAAQLAPGAQRLAGGLSSAAAGGATLHGGLTRLRGGARRFASQLRGIRLTSAGARALSSTLRSGFAVLAAVDRSGRTPRTAATFLIDLQRGGTAALATVIPAGNPLRAGNPAGGELRRSTAALDRRAGLTSYVGGPAPLSQEFASESGARVPLLLGALVLVTYLILVPVLRSVLLPLIAVVLNAVTVAAAFGVLCLLFQGSPPPLGGAGFLDGIMVLAILSIVFGLSIDYEVFLLARMREEYDASGDTATAVRRGVMTTASVITGAATIMTAVFVAFALSGLASLRQLGVGLTVAVLLDATLVRLVLLPAIVRLIGPAVWWRPRLNRRTRCGAPTALPPSGR